MTHHQLDQKKNAWGLCFRGSPRVVHVRLRLKYKQTMTAQRTIQSRRYLYFIVVLFVVHHKIYLYRSKDRGTAIGQSSNKVSKPPLLHTLS